MLNCVTSRRNPNRISMLPTLVRWKEVESVFDLSRAKTEKNCTLKLHKMRIPHVFHSDRMAEFLQQCRRIPLQSPGSSGFYRKRPDIFLRKNASQQQNRFSASPLIQRAMPCVGPAILLTSDEIHKPKIAINNGERRPTTVFERNRMASLRQQDDMTAIEVVEAAALNEPLALSEKYRPRQISGFLGLRGVKEVLAGFVKNPSSSAWLLHGPTGIGKTSAGMALANEIPAQLHHIPAKLCTLETVEKLCRQCQYAPARPEDWSRVRFHLCLIDECDAMTRPAQLLFLSKLEAVAAPPATIFVFTTNAVESLYKKFVSRCKKLEFSTKGIEPELSSLLAEIWTREAPGRSAPDFDQIAHAADGDIRAAINVLEMRILSSQKLSGEVPHVAKSTAIKTFSDRDIKQSPIERFHPLSQVFPDMSPESYAALKLDVEEHGVRVPVVIYEGMVLDGRSRSRAAQELRIACPTLEYEGSKPVSEVVSLNAIRRLDLTSGQRAMTAAKLANLGEGRPTKTQSIDGVSEEKAARLFNVSVKSVERAKIVLAANRLDLIDAVSSGRMSVSKAANIVSRGENGTTTRIEPSTKSSPKNAFTPDQDPVWVWKEMLHFEERRIMDRAPAELLSQMSEQQSADVFRIAPALIAWLQGFVGEPWDGLVPNSP